MKNKYLKLIEIGISLGLLFGVSNFFINQQINKEKKIKEISNLIDNIAWDWMKYYQCKIKFDSLPDEYLKKLNQEKIDSLKNYINEKIDVLLNTHYKDLIEFDKFSFILYVGKELNKIDDIMLDIALKEKNTGLAQKIIFQKLKETNDEKYIKKLEEMIKIIKKRNENRISLVSDIDIFYKILAYTILYENTKNEKYKKILEELEKNY